MNKKDEISARVADLLASATVKQKAKVYCLDWQENNLLRETPAITKDEADAIVKSLSVKDTQEFWRYVHCYNVYALFAPTFGLLRATFLTETYRIISILTGIEDYVYEANRLNIIRTDLAEASPEAVSTFDKSVRELPFSRLAKVCIKDGVVTITYSRMWQQAKEEAAGILTECYEQYKAVILVVEEWTKENRCGFIMPDLIRNCIDYAKKDIGKDIAPTYSRKILQERADRGETITDGDRERAIFPSYEEIQPTEAQIQAWREKLSETERNA